MAIYLPGIAGEIFGSIGGVTFSKVGSGFNVIKKKALPFRTSTPARLAVRTFFSRAIDAWKNTLTSGNKDDWNDAAANFVQTRHGVAYSISGQNLHAAHYNLMSLAGLTPIAAPTLFGGRLTNPTITPAWDAVAHKVELTWDPNPTANEKILMWWTNADRPDSFYRRIKYRNFAVITNATGEPFALDAEYRAQDGTLHMHWIMIDVRGAMSTPGEDFFSFIFV